MTQSKLNGIKPLAFASKAYMDAHLNFRRNQTNQGELMLEYLKATLKRHIQTHNLSHFRLASIGSGTGIIDAPLVEYLQQFATVSYLGIEPNEHENKMAKMQMDDVLEDSSRARFFSGVIEDYDASGDDGRFDAIIAVHVTYYSPDIRPMVQKAFSMLNPGHGIFVPIVSANTPQNELFVETTQALYGFAPHLSGKCRALLDDMGARYETEEIEAGIDIRDFLENPQTRDAKLFMDFFVHADSDSIPDAEKQRFWRIFEQQAIAENDALILPHMADAFVARLSSRH